MVRLVLRSWLWWLQCYDYGYWYGYVGSM